jgi:carbonic anhydrase
MKNQLSPSSEISPLPSYLVKRFKGWRASQYEENRSWFQHLAEMGQHPRAMVISCCDSRVHAISLFGAESGEFFIHRNIANLIPPFNPNGDHHGTSAALEYAVTVLKVAHIIVLGHSGCGGIKGGFHSCNQTKGEPYSDTSFIEKWLQILKPAFDQLDHDKPEDDRINDLEKTSILVSIENLMGFPFVIDAIANNRLTIHGLWHNIGKGDLYGYDNQSGQFERF